MKIRTTIVCLPVQDLGNTLTFYRNVFGLTELQAQEGMIALELPNLSMFLMDANSFETYSRKAGRGVRFPNGDVGTILSCALMTKDDVDIALQNAPRFGGAATGKATIDETYGGYIGYISDPDGHLWELVYPPAQS